MSAPDRQAEWTFYDEWQAFPLTRLQREPNIAGVLRISLVPPGGGTEGEFAIVFHCFGDRDVARLEAFGDAWEVLDRSGLITHLAALDKPTKDGIVRLLVGLGYRDVTADLYHEIRCTSCHGRGVL